MSTNAVSHVGKSLFAAGIILLGGGSVLFFTGFSPQSSFTPEGILVSALGVFLVFVGFILIDREITS